MTDIIDRFAGASPAKGIKNPCRTATTANITLSGEQTVDGIAVVADDRVLVKNQTDQTENGVYTASTGSWARAKDFDGNNDIVQGTLVLVSAGTVAAGQLYQVTTANPITIDTSNIVFAAIAVSTANAILTGLGAMGTGTGIVAQTAAATFAKRTLTGTSNQISVSNGDGVSGNPTFSLDATLVALAALDSTAGVLTQTGADTFVRRTLAAPAAGFTITNPAGTAGNPTFVLADDLAGLEGMSGTGLVVRTGSSTYSQRTLTGTSQQITVTNGDGVSGNPTLTLPSILQFGSSHTLNAGATNSAIIAGDTNAIGSGGDGSVICGGAVNTANALDGFIAGGATNTIASGSVDSTIIGGVNNSISNATDAAIITGSSCTISGAAAECGIYSGSGNSITAASDYAVILGGFSNAISGTGDVAAILSGGSNTISATSHYNIILGGSSNSIVTGATYSSAQGLYAKTSRHGQVSQASGRFTVVGDAQTSVFVMRKQTTDVAPAEMFLDGSALRLTVPTDSTYGFDIMVVARRTNADNESAFYKFEGCIDNNAGTTALVGSVVVATPIEDTAGWACAVTADDTNDALIITVTGENAKTINWVARVSLVEVTG